MSYVSLKQKLLHFVIFVVFLLFFCLFLAGVSSASIVVLHLLVLAVTGWKTTPHVVHVHRYVHVPYVNILIVMNKSSCNVNIATGKHSFPISFPCEITLFFESTVPLDFIPTLTNPNIAIVTVAQTVCHGY